VYVLAYIIRPLVTDEINRGYFFPALTVRIIGAIAVGVLYQFYYGSGDTFMYHTYGSRHIWKAFMDSPALGLKLLLADGTPPAGTYKYASQIYFFRDPQSYAVIRFAALMDLFTFSTYSATAVLFGCFSFCGMWLFYLAFYEQHPHLHRPLAIAAFFIPSVFFWGSGLLKDTITLGCLGAATFLTYRIFLCRQMRLSFILSLLAVLYGLYVIKIYILLTFLPAAIFWVFIYYFDRIRVLALKIFLFPVVMGISLYLGYTAIDVTGKDHAKYSLTMLSKTAQVTAYDIRYWSGREAGSGYSLGKLDGSWKSMISMAPGGISVSLFRPFLWEIRNPLMVLSAIESFILTLATLYVIARLRGRLSGAIQQPAIVFCLMFSITFAFAVGVSTFNFGTLARYKIPLMPFYLVALILLLDFEKRKKSFGVSSN
jgi:hypothetical protein